MIPYFFLDTADNRGDGFSYEILPVKHYTDISCCHKPTNLVRRMVRSQDITSPERLSCVNKGGTFKFCDREGSELFGDVELSISIHKSKATTHSPITPSGSSALDEYSPILHSEEVNPIPIINEHALQTIVEHTVFSNTT